MHTLEYQRNASDRPLELGLRALVFALAATSIGCLLAEFYGIMSMRAFTLWVFIPCAIGLVVWAVADRGRVARIVWIGAVAGFLAACVYDVFRLPFVFARELHIDSVVPALPLFKVFPKFGFMIHYGYADAEAVKQQVGFYPHNGATDHLLGWAYHFSNGMTFGIMYLALIGNAARRSWLWAVVFAVGLEIALLVTPYASFFGIHKTPAFIAVTMAAHVVFGVVLGLSARWLWLYVGWAPRPRS